MKTWIFLIPLVFIGFFSIVSLFYEPSWFFNWSGIRTEVKELVHELEDFERKKKGHFNISEKANVDELERLIKYPDASIRTAAYIGLMRKDTSILFEIAKMAVLDKNEMYVFQNVGCTPSSNSPAEFIYKEILYLVNDGSEPPSPRIIWGIF